MSVKFCSLATINFTPATGGKEKNIILGVALQFNYNIHDMAHSTI